MRDLESLNPEENFLGLAGDLCQFQRAQAVILPVPYEATTTYVQGTANGPGRILLASQEVELYDNELDCDPCSVGVATLAPMQFEDTDHEGALDSIAERAEIIQETGKFMIALGGEHSISIPLIIQSAAQFPGLSVLHLDAHSDLRDTYQGSRKNHACVMARVNEVCDFVSIGLRSGIQHEAQGLRPGARLFYAHEMVQRDTWMEEAILHLAENVYLTIDLDFFDPAFMPAVGTPEPGGFGWYETLAFLHQVFRERNVVACDIVELSPISGMVHPDFFAAKLCYKLIGYKFYARSGQSPEDH